MKKKIATMVCACACAIMLALPSLAFAAPSPTNPIQTASAYSNPANRGGLLMTVSVRFPEPVWKAGGILWVSDSTPYAAEGAYLEADEDWVGKFEIGVGYAAGQHDEELEAMCEDTVFDITLDADDVISNKLVHGYLSRLVGKQVFVSEYDYRFNNGSIHLTMTSPFSFDTFKANFGSGGEGKDGRDLSDTSPQTGIPFTTGIFALFSLVLLATGVMLVIRKKSEK